MRANPMLAALLGAACISSSAIVVQLAHCEAGTTSFYRCALALPGLLVLSALERRRHGERDASQRVRAIIAGGFLGVDLVLWTHAIYDVGAGIATVLGNLQVLFVTFIAWAVWKDRPGARFLAALPVVLVGVVLVAGLVEPARSGYHPVAGVLYGLGTSVTYAAFILILRHSTTSSRHVAGPLADATIGAALASVLLGLAMGEMRFSLTAPALGWLILLALVSQSVGWLLITSSLPRLKASVSSLLLLLQPAASLLLAAVVLGERPSPLQLGGAVLLCGGVVFATRAATKSAPEVEPTPG